jgi:hypothetical protein
VTWNEGDREGASIGLILIEPDGELWGEGFQDRLTMLARMTAPMDIPSPVQYIDW